MISYAEICLVWCIKDISVFNHAYPCINNRFITNIVVYVLVIHPVIPNMVY